MNNNNDNNDNKLHWFYCMCMFVLQYKFFSDCVLKTTAVANKKNVLIVSQFCF